MEKPFHHQHIKDYLLKTKNHTVSVCENYEADDGMAIAQMKAWLEEAKKHMMAMADQDPEDYFGNTCICSRDKDLKMVPGNHFSWKSGKQKEETMFITYKGGYKWFFMQLLMGDAVDNIPGLYRVGQVSAKKLLGEASGPLDWFIVCQQQYEARFGSYWRQFLWENARLLWMLRKEDDDIRDFLKQLEKEQREREGLEEIKEGY